MKKSLIFVGLFLVLIFIISSVSAGFFSDFYGKITGQVTDTQTCVDSDGEDYYVKGNVEVTNHPKFGDKIFLDTCANGFDTDYGTQYSLSFSGDTLVEMTCLDDGKTPNTVYYEGCPYGCVDGVCADEVSCIPNCASKTSCGDDGCGGSCGTCDVGENCVSGVCISQEITCIPDCTNKQCGDDDCGGSCGTCNIGEECGERNSCQNQPPNVIEATIFPDSSSPGVLFTITANIVDINGISTSDLPQAIIQKPDENPINIVILFDDGVHGDSALGDGIYGNIWDSTGQSDGDYFIDIIARDTLDNSIEAENILQFEIKKSAFCIQVINNGLSANKIDVVFVGSGFPTIEDFDWVVDEFIDYNGEMDGLLSVEPFKSNREKFNFWRVDNLYNFSDDFTDPNSYIFLWKNEARNNCPFADELIFLSVYPNSIRPSAGIHHLQMSIGTQYLSDIGWPLILDRWDMSIAHNKLGLRKILIHEFGHSFGGLYDEYLFGDLVPEDQQPNNVINCDTYECSSWCDGNPSQPEPDKNQFEAECLAVTNEIQCNNNMHCLWDDRMDICRSVNFYNYDFSGDLGLNCIEDTGCFAGCGPTNWYRAYENTVMRNPYLTKEYKTVNENWLQVLLNEYE